MEKDTQSRSWMLTQDASKITFEELQEALKNYIYIGQKERGKQGGIDGYEHYQIYIENNNQIRFSTLKTKLPNCHIEERKGTKQQAYNYVTKSDTKIGDTFGNGEINTKEEQGKRNDLYDIIMMLENGASMSEIRLAYPSQYFLYRINTYLQSMRQDNMRGKRRQVEVTYISGKTGTGKTSYVLDKYGDENVFIMARYGEFYKSEEKFDGYNGEDVILFDEFRSSISLAKMLRYLDVYYCELPARNHDKIACYTKVYVTSNWKLNEQYKLIQEERPGDYQAFLRRFHNVYDFDSLTPLENIKKKKILIQDNIDNIFPTDSKIKQ